MGGAAVTRVLVIKLGALGDFVQALGPMQAIRRHHPAARLTLLTTPPFEALGRRCGWFDDVWTTRRSRRPGDWLALRRRLIGGRFDMVYDLQTSDRSSFMWHLMWPCRPPMSGIARGCSHPHDNPARDRMHTIDRQRDQLARAGIAEVPPPDLGWMAGDLSGLDLPEAAPGGGYALLVPGGAAHRPDKRWPVARYADLAGRLAGQGMTPLLIGTAADAEATDAIARACPAAIDLTGRTDVLTLAALARRAALAVGNDTGPMHLCALAGCPCLVLYGAASDPALCGQRGAAVKIMRVDRLDDLDIDVVAHAAADLRAGVER
ncbi:glycosyltransferase family 9 protein [Marivibrio halodurans]|uniref:Glycosyltransferase family 9 protein n=2 Tax=Marivibrio halodurans TaxID=2039722 RepID=A0A8J7S2L6_9PROT|nr:glycosyltransferase family 9 protein [Marivibrio halodurans]